MQSSRIYLFTYFTPSTDIFISWITWTFTFLRLFITCMDDHNHFHTIKRNPAMQKKVENTHEVIYQKLLKTKQIEQMFSLRNSCNRRWALIDGSKTQPGKILHCPTRFATQKCTATVLFFSVYLTARIYFSFSRTLCDTACWHCSCTQHSLCTGWRTKNPNCFQTTIP